MVDDRFVSFLELREYAQLTIKSYCRYTKDLDPITFNQKTIDYLLTIPSFKNRSAKAALKAYIECYNIQNVKIPPRKGRKGESLPKSLSDEELEKLIIEAPEIIDTGIVVMYHTGLRISELINTKFGDIDWIEQTISGKGKGNKPYRLPLSDRALRYLWRDYNNAGKGLKIRPFMIPTIKKSTQNGQRQKWLKILVKLGKKTINKKVTPHMLRHSCATTLTKAGVHPQEIAQLLRHDDIKTTMIYSLLTFKEIKKAQKTVFK